MWLFTPFGFFSIVRKPGEEELCIRARDRKDLENLKERYLPQSGGIIMTDVADYPCRMYAHPQDVALAMAEITEDIDYGNFKSEVMKEQGMRREGIYMRVWSAMLDAEPTDHSRRRRDAWRREDEKKGRRWSSSSAYSGQGRLYDAWDDWGDDWGFGRGRGGSGRGNGGRELAPVTPIRRNDSPGEIHLSDEDITIIDEDDRGDTEPAIRASDGLDKHCSGNCHYCGQYDEDGGCHLGLLHSYDIEKEERQDEEGVFLGRETEEVRRFIADSGFFRDQDEPKNGKGNAKSKSKSKKKGKGKNRGKSHPQKRFTQRF